jgi:hypothetical protein
MYDDFSALADSLNRVDPGTFRRLLSHRPHQALQAAMEISFAATSPNENVADSVREYVEVIPLRIGLASRDWKVSVAAYATVMNIARRFGPEYGLSQSEIEEYPFQVCQNLADDRQRDREELQTILYPETHACRQPRQL